MSNQQVTNNGSKHLLLHILISQLERDRAIELQTLFYKLKRDEVSKHQFVQLMKGIVGEQMLKSAITELQQQIRLEDAEMFQAPLNTNVGGDASNSRLPDSDADNNAMIQDERLQGQTVPVYHQHTQTNAVQGPVFNHEAIKPNNPNCESQYSKLQQTHNQQATVNEQPSSQINCSKKVPIGLLLPIIIPQLAEDKAIELQTLSDKLKSGEIPKDQCVRLMKGIVEDQMLRKALTKVQQQIKSNMGSSGQQHPVSMPTVTSNPPEFNDPHALAKLHQISMNAAADHSHNNSSVIQVKTGPTYSTMDISTKKSQEHDVRVVEPTQLLPSSSNTVSQETEKSPVHTQGFYNQQEQHIHFPSPYEISGGDFNPFLGTTTGSLSFLRPQPHNSHKRRIPHQSIGLNHLGVEQQISFNNPKRMRGGSVSTMVNNTSSQQTLNSWQPLAEHNSGLFSSVSYKKKDPNDPSTEQQHKHHSSKLHGLPSVNSGQNEQGGSVNQGTVKNQSIPIGEEEIEVPAGEAEGEWEQQVAPPEQQANQQEPATPEPTGQTALHQILDVLWEIRTDFRRLESTVTNRLGAVEARLKDLEESVIQITVSVMSPRSRELD